MPKTKKTALSIPFAEWLQYFFNRSSPERATENSPGSGREADATRGNDSDKPTFSSFAPVKANDEKALPRSATIISTKHVQCSAFDVPPLCPIRNPLSRNGHSRHSKLFQPVRGVSRWKTPRGDGLRIKKMQKPQHSNQIKPHQAGARAPISIGFPSHPSTISYQLPAIRQTSSFSQIKFTVVF
jgi:hypothetical protein